MKNNDDKTSKNTLTIAKILWITIGSTPIIFLLVILMLENPEVDRTGVKISEVSFSDPVVLALSLTAICIFFAAQKLPSLLFRGSQPHRQQILIPFMVRLALFEAIAIIGFVLSIIKSSDFAYLPFLFISLAGFLSSSPSKSLRVRTVSNQ